MSEERKIQSRQLLGITKNDDDHRVKADMHSTGAMLLPPGGDPADSRDWSIEYKCDVCHELIQMWSADTNDLIREGAQGERHPAQMIHSPEFSNAILFFRSVHEPRRHEG